MAFASVKVIASPVIEGLEKAKLISRIAETIFAMNKEVLIFIQTSIYFLLEILTLSFALNKK